MSYSSAQGGNQQRQKYMGEIVKAAWNLSRFILSHPTSERWGISWWFQRKVIQVLILGGGVARWETIAVLAAI